MNDDIFFGFDLETNGLDVDKNEPVEIGFTLVRPSGPYNITSMIVKSEVEMNPKALEIHGLGKEITSLGVRPYILAQFMTMMARDVRIKGVMGYNIFKYDLPMMKSLMDRYCGSGDLLYRFEIEDPAIWWLCDEVFKCRRPRNIEEYRDVAKRMIPKGTKYSLVHVCEQSEIVLNNAHRAGADLDASIKLWRQMRGEAQFSGEPKGDANGELFDSSVECEDEFPA